MKIELTEEEKEKLPLLIQAIGEILLSKMDDGKWAEIINESESNISKDKYNLEKAKRIYPKGTRFRSAESGREHVSNGDFHQQYHDQLTEKCIWVDGIFCFYDGKWAEKIDKEDTFEKCAEAYKYATKIDKLNPIYNLSDVANKLNEVIEKINNESK